MRNSLIAIAISALLSSSVCTAASAFEIEDEVAARGDLNGVVVDLNTAPVRQATTLFGNVAIHRPAHQYKAPMQKATDDIYGVVYEARNKHNSFPHHPDVAYGVVYAPAPQFNGADAARTVNTGMSIFSGVMNLVNSCSGVGYSSGYSSGGRTGGYQPVHTPRVTPSFSRPSCSGH